MVHDTAYITYRATQNPDTPDLPFAQEYPIHTQADIPINFGQQVLSLSSLSNRAKSCYNITYTSGQKSTQSLSVSIANYYRLLGYKVVKCSDDTTIKPASSPHWTKKEIEKIFIDYYGDDIKRLDRIHKEQEDRITAGYEHRMNIESKVEKNISAFTGIHTTLSDLGRSTTAVSSALEAHKLEDSIGGIGGGILGGGMVSLAIVGIGAYLLLRRKK